MMKKIIYIFLSVLFLLILVGCSNSRITVDIVDPIENHITSQDLDIRNCGTRKDLRKTLASEYQIDENITINDQTASLDNIEDSLTADLRTQLEKQIKATYKEVYESAKRGMEETALTIPANEVRTYRINWEEKVFNAEVHFTSNDETRTWSYSYSLGIPQVGEVWQSGCTA